VKGLMTRAARNRHRRNAVAEGMPAVSRDACKAEVPAHGDTSPTALTLADAGSEQHETEAGAGADNGDGGGGEGGGADGLRLSYEDFQAVAGARADDGDGGGGGGGDDLRLSYEEFQEALP